MAASCVVPVGDTAVGVGMGVRRPPEIQMLKKNHSKQPHI